MDGRNLCTCTDLKCANHPANHENGCTPCVAKCLALDEIPSCFFKKVTADTSGVTDYSFKGFANFLREHK